MTRFAVIGMGRMGQAAAMRLLDCGHEVFVWNRTLGRTSEVVSAGARAPADLAETVEAGEIVVTVLSDDDAVRDVAFDSGNLAKLLDERLYVDASTVSPDMTDELADQIERFIAMPIAGAPTALREGKAVCLVGGPGELIDEAAQLIEALSANHHRYPRAALASVAKVANNNLLLVGLAAVAESIAIGRAGGLTDQQLEELLGSSSMLGPGVSNRLSAILAGDGPPMWSVDLAVKDADLAVGIGRIAASAVPVTVAAAERYGAAADRGLGAQDIAAIARLYQNNLETA
jgi:3-hydroxyisobutyrate dehydrogenase